MSKMNEIIKKYSTGELTLEQANQQLEDIGSTVRLNPLKNTISGEEMAKTVVSDDPSKVSGWGMMNHGVGSMEKMHIQNGKLDYDTGFYDGTAVMYVKGNMYAVNGDHLEVYKKK